MNKNEIYSGKRRFPLRTLFCLTLILCCAVGLAIVASASEATTENEGVGNCPYCLGELTEEICGSYVCLQCGNTLVDKHSYKKTINEATCTDKGESVFTCKCGNSYTVDIPATGHNYITTGQLDACKTCSDCGKQIDTHEPAYRNNNGKCQNYCQICKYVFFNAEHITEDVVIEPTCTERGYTLTSCQVCKQEIRRTYFPARGHVKEADDGNAETAIRCIYCNATIVKGVYKGSTQIDGMNEMAFKIYKVITRVSVFLAIISFTSCGYKFLGSIFFGNFASMAGNDMMKAQRQFVFTLLGLMFIILLPRLFGGAIALFERGFDNGEGGILKPWTPG